MAPRDYARLHWDWHEDEVVEAIADEEPTVLAAWPVLVAMATKASDATDNPRGVLRVTWPKLAAKLRRPVDEVERVMALLVEGELVEVEPVTLGMQRVSLVRFGDWQVPRRSKAAEQQQRRDRQAASRDFGAERGVDVGSASGSYKEKEREKEKKVKPSPSASADQVEEVFAYWCKVEAATGGFGSTGRQPKLTKDRASKIRARLAEDFSVVDLKKAIAFFAKDPHHAGDNDRGTRFTDLTTTLRAGSKVEQGIAGYEQRHAVGGTSAGGRTSKDDAANEVW